MFAEDWSLKHVENNIRNNIHLLGGERNESFNNVFRNGIQFNVANFDVENPSGFFQLSSELNTKEFYADMVADCYINNIDVNIRSIDVFLSLVNTLILSKIDDDTYEKTFIYILHESNDFIHSIVNTFIFGELRNTRPSPTDVCLIATIIKQFKDFHILFDKIMNRNKNNLVFRNIMCENHNMQNMCDSIINNNDYNSIVSFG